MLFRSTRDRSLERSDWLSTSQTASLLSKSCSNSWKFLPTCSAWRVLMDTSNLLIPPLSAPLDGQARNSWPSLTSNSSIQMTVLQLPKPWQSWRDWVNRSLALKIVTCQETATGDGCSGTPMLSLPSNSSAAWLATSLKQRNPGRDCVRNMKWRVFCRNRSSRTRPYSRSSGRSAKHYPGTLARSGAWSRTPSFYASTTLGLPAAIKQTAL